MIGWIGSTLLALCGLPQAIKSIQEGHSNGISWGFILMWTVGEICTLVYIVSEAYSAPLLFNYMLNCVFCGIILYYKLRSIEIGRKRQ